MMVLRIFWVWASCMTVAFALETSPFQSDDSDNYSDCREDFEEDIRDPLSVSFPITTKQQLRLFLEENNISLEAARTALNTNNNPTSQTNQALFQKCVQELLLQAFQLAAGNPEDIDISHGLKILNLLGELEQLIGFKDAFSQLWSSPNHSHPPKKTRKKQRNNSQPRWKKAVLCMTGAIILNMIKHWAQKKE